MYPTPTLTEMEAHKHQLWTGYIWVNKSHSRRDQWTEPFALINPFALIDPFISPHWLHRLLNPFMNWNGVFSHPTSDITQIGQPEDTLPLKGQRAIIKHPQKVNWVPNSILWGQLWGSSFTGLCTGRITSSPLPQLVCPSSTQGNTSHAEQIGYI